jgi:rhodanese-related sulfurtransferase
MEEYQDSPDYSEYSHARIPLRRGLQPGKMQIVCFLTMKIFTFFLSLAATTALIADEKPYAPENMPGTTIVSAEEVIEMIIADPELVVIDSRKKTEYIKGHIEGAVNIVNTELMFEDLEFIAPDRNRALLFYCNGARCLRSSDSITRATGWGYTNIFWFRGGWKEWTEKRLPVVTD